MKKKAYIMIGFLAHCQDDNPPTSFGVIEIERSSYNI